MQLRPYQQDCVDEAMKYFASKRKDKKAGIIVAPTGSGKSVIIAATIAALPEGTRTLILQPSKELLEQNALKYKAITGEFPAIYSASAGSKVVGKVTYATLGSIYKKPELFERVNFILIDECHLYPAEGMLKKFLDGMLDAQMLGYTATPFRMKYSRDYGSCIQMLNKSKSSPFGEFVHIVQIADVVPFWSVLKYNHRGERYRRDLLRLNTTGSDYTEESMQEAARSIRDDMVADIAKYTDKSKPGTYKSVVIFEATVASAYETAESLSFAGVRAEVVTGETPKDERAQIVSDFKSGKLTCLVNVGVFIVGFDAPETDLIILARPTGSLAVYYQQVGRGTRPHPDKSYCRIFDYCGAYEKFGRVEQLNFRYVPRSGWNLFAGDTRLSGRYTF